MRARFNFMFLKRVESSIRDMQELRDILLRCPEAQKFVEDLATEMAEEAIKEAETMPVEDEAKDSV